MLADLLDIRDETWRNAAEGYLGNNRLALVVEPAYAAAAMEMPMVHRVDPEFFTDVESGMNIALDVEQGTITIL